jgi:hypothetical protein
VRDAGPGLDPAEDGGPNPASACGIPPSDSDTLYGADHSFDLKALDGGGLLVAIDLPFRRS